jgi:hypothetical protein
MQAKSMNWKHFIPVYATILALIVGWIFWGGEISQNMKQFDRHVQTYEPRVQQLERDESRTEAEYKEILRRLDELKDNSRAKKSREP